MELLLEEIVPVFHYPAILKSPFKQAGETGRYCRPKQNKQKNQKYCIIA